VVTVHEIISNRERIN